MHHTGGAGALRVLNLGFREGYQATQQLCTIQVGKRQGKVCTIQVGLGHSGATRQLCRYKGFLMTHGSRPGAEQLPGLALAALISCGCGGCAHSKMRWWFTLGIRSAFW